MPRIIAFCVPDSVRHSLISGVYGDPFQDGVRIEQTAATQLRVSRVFDVPEALPENEAERIRGAQARRLLRDLNRLIRWFRVLGQQPGLVELSLGKVGGVSFAVESTRQPWGRIEATDERVSSAVSLAAVAEDAQTFYAGGSEPPVEDLFLLDAQEALREGRFREAILFCWSVIDATFNNVFGRLVDAKLPEEWGESRAYMKSIDFPLRQKMSAGMKLLCGRSLFNEPEGFWDRLSASYSKRNKIIHEGQNASEEEAKSSLVVAQQLVVKLKEVTGATELL